MMIIHLKYCSTSHTYNPYPMGSYPPIAQSIILGCFGRSRERGIVSFLNNISVNIGNKDIKTVGKLLEKESTPIQPP
jgi:hypothetical protein